MSEDELVSEMRPHSTTEGTEVSNETRFNWNFRPKELITKKPKWGETTDHIHDTSLLFLMVSQRHIPAE